MPLPKPTKLFWTVLTIGLVVTALVFYLSRSKVDYNAEVKPILNEHCISCHGGVKRQGGFSLLFRSEALEVNKSGKAAIIPGDASGSQKINGQRSRRKNAL
jgi:mono/diheme cytochrome c family protein